MGIDPNWAKDPKIAYKTINAWVQEESSRGKIPYSISMKDDSPFVFAGLWEGWKDPATGEWLRTCAIITGEPNQFVREIHTRMPVILAEEHHDAWLSGEAGKEILVPYPADRMKAWPISPRVNSPKNDDPEVILQIELNPRFNLASDSYAEKLL